MTRMTKKVSSGTMSSTVNTRDAVESAIDLSRSDKAKSWEKLAKTSRRITRWGADSHHQGEDNESD